MLYSLGEESCRCPWDEGYGGCAANDSPAAAQCLEAWREAWPRLMAGGSLKQIAAYQYLFGFWPAQIVWDDTSDIIRPELKPWHARYTYYQWDVRQYVAITQDGPRPIVAGEAARYGRHFAVYCSIKPGITGLWQISGRNDVSYAQRVALDQTYVSKLSLWGDAVILLKTPAIVLSKRGAR